MKKWVIFLCCMVSFCSQKKNSVEDIYIPFKLERPQMEQFIRVLPLVLKKSEEFKKLELVKNLSDEEYNDQFYSFLYKDPISTQALKDAGFTGKVTYAEFHNTVLENFILITENKDIVEEAVMSIPKIQKEYDSLLLKYNREPNNISLERTLNQVKASLIFYKNIVLMDAFYAELNAFNQ
ncbi:MAG: hypothetical protein ACRCTQ_06740 [Brevinemataceae bacterium]